MAIDSTKIDEALRGVVRLVAEEIVADPEYAGTDPDRQAIKVFSALKGRINNIEDLVDFNDVVSMLNNARVRS